VTALLIAIGVLAALAIVQAVLVSRDRRRFGSPGTMVDGLHVLRQGHGLPAVVFESGIANSCLSWNVVQAEVARHTTTYSYDRAGLGWSAPPRSPCSLDGITADLHALLDRLGVSRPVVLVGHSFGAYVVRSYANRFPSEVGALVLVDPATPEEWMAPNPQQLWRLRRAIFFTRAAEVLAYFGIVRFGLWVLLLRKKETPGPLSRFSETLQRIRFELRKVRPEVLPFIRAHWSRPGFYQAMAAHLQVLPECAMAVSNLTVPKGIAVTVLSGAHQPPERLAEHAAVATRHIIASKGAHFIYLDEPELVINAVREALRPLQIPQENQEHPASSRSRLAGSK
jgi:pimeloyl-ACP methyl ester carboxylesterase